VPVISASENMKVIAIYVADEKHPLAPIPVLLNRANQALQTLERYKLRLAEVSNELSSLEIEDLVTLREVVTLLQRTEMVRRIAAEIEFNIVELGKEGRLVSLQLEEIMAGVEDDRRLVIMDYFHEDADWHLDEVMEALDRLATDDLLDVKAVASTLHLSEAMSDLEASLAPRGYRLLSRIPRLPIGVIDHIVRRFGSLSKIMRATIDDLEDVEGVGGVRATSIKDGLSRLAESSILDAFS